MMNTPGGIPRLCSDGALILSGNFYFREARRTVVVVASRRCVAVAAKLSTFSTVSELAMANMSFVQRLTRRQKYAGPKFPSRFAAT